MAAVDDPARAVLLADELFEDLEASHRVALIQCGRANPLAVEVAAQLQHSGRAALPQVIHDREQAQSEKTLRSIADASAVWVFADNLFDAFMNLFASQLAFALRAAALKGLPVIGIGNGALALGGLMVARRVCHGAQYDLVSGLGWAPRVLLEGGAASASHRTVSRNSVCSLPGLLGVDLGERGGVSVLGGRVQSVGDEPVALFGANDRGYLLTLRLEPGASTTIAPPPFAPFTEALLPSYVLDALQQEQHAVVVPPRQAPPPAKPASSPHGPLCPMCNKVHPPRPQPADLKAA